MPRKSLKSSPVGQSTSKRPAADTPNRTSKRARATSRKSYVEPDTDSEAASNKASEEESGDASDFEAQSGKEATSESEPDEDASDDESASKKATPRGRSQKKSLTTHKKNVDEKELWKPGAKLEPGTQLIIKKPKARDAGDTPYNESTIHPNTMLFLNEIKANNDRQWLKCTLPPLSASIGSQ
jgi:hypothetical protein